MTDGAGVIMTYSASCKLALLEQFPVATFFVEDQRVELRMSADDTRPAATIFMDVECEVFVELGYRMDYSVDQLEALLNYAKSIDPRYEDPTV